MTTAYRVDRIALAVTLVAAAGAVTAVLTGAGASAADVGPTWRPRGIVPSTAALADVLAANERASGTWSAALARRRERWTYATAGRSIAVDLAVRDGDWRTTLELDGLSYTAGRTGAARWRGDGNGIVHGVEADLQGDPLDRAPESLFPLAGRVSLAGEAAIPKRAWVLEAVLDGDKPAFFYVDEATGTVAREVVRDGKQSIVTDFSDYEPTAGYLRPRRWRVRDGNRAHDLDVAVDSIEPGPVDRAALAFPARRELGPDVDRTVDLGAFGRPGSGFRIPVRIGGKRREFILDCGTTSISITTDLARRVGGTTLDHAVLSDLAVGPLRLERVSALAVGDLDARFGFDGILGLDFFAGRVVEIDYPRQRVRLLSRADAAKVFADPRAVVVPANVDQGMPLVSAAFGTAASDAFVIDTGSPRLYVMKPFAEREAAVISTWTKTRMPYVTGYLEGGLEVQPYRAASFALGAYRFENVPVGMQIPTSRTDDIGFPFDGIIGTDILRSFVIDFDYGGGRIALRQ